ncbi:MAG: acyl-CoA transferase [Alphaproteobacteria bacterium]|nr:acyl-CoA transferase [Alphaproteobacteria bacterium]
MTAYITNIEAAFKEDTAEPWSLNVTGEGILPSWFAVSDFAAATVGAAGIALSRYAANGGMAAPVTVDRRLASLWFGMTIHPEGWEMPPVWDAVAGDYQAKDGWIRLHTNADHHRAVALSVLGTAEDRDEVTAAVANWEVGKLEAAIVAAGGCAATMRSLDAWADHPQGGAVAQEPLVAWAEHDSAEPKSEPIDPARPLAGLRVLDLTRVLAGPVATRFLAAFGADVLRIDPLNYDEANVAPEVTLGKRCAELNLRDADDRKIFEGLLSSADVLVHGYRAGALPGLAYGPEERRALNPGLVDVSHNAYGWTGPWADWRGFDSLVQMSSGIAQHGMAQAGAEKPVPLPVQALDHGTGYLIAASVLHALAARRQGRVMSARLSLARTARLLTKEQTSPTEDPIQEGADDIASDVENTTWGPARRTGFPLMVGAIVPRWDYPATALGSAVPAWT